MIFEVEDYCCVIQDLHRVKRYSEPYGDGTGYELLLRSGEPGDGDAMKAWDRQWFYYDTHGNGIGDGI